VATTDSTSTQAAADRSDLEAFRASLRAWLEANVPKGRGPWNQSGTPENRAFRVALYDAGFFGLTWPKEYGGQGLTAEHQRVFNEEMARYPDVPVGELVTVGICAPTLLDFGSEEQKRRHIPRMLRGDETWTQLLSEPGAGSDLAGLQTRAVRDGDQWVVNGQKVWTSGAHLSQFGILIARTNPEVPKHSGLSMFIVDFSLPGITVRPLRQMTGEAHFNEVFLDDVHLPLDALVGAENDGWRALTRMLMHERVAIGAGTGGSRMGRDMFGDLLALARKRGVDQLPAVREALVDLYTKEKLLAWMGQRMRAEAAAGKPPGPEGSLAKLANAILSRTATSLGMLIGGPGAQAWEPEDPEGGDLAHQVTFSPMTGIAGGTSEIQRNTIGERVLGLPKEPQTDRNIPFKDVPQASVASRG